MTEVKQKSISLLFQSGVSISYMLVVSTDFENGFAKTMQKVADLREKVESAKRIASAMFSIPDMDAGGIVNAFGGIDFHVASYGGRKLGEAALTMAESYLSKALEREAAALQQKAKGEEKKATEEETFEESIATSEIDQTQKQIIINTIHQEQNEKEQERFEKELEWDEEEYEFLCDKFTNKDLHEWLVKQMTKLSKTMCKLTTKVAKMAEKCYHFEIGDTDMGNAKTFISNSYWDGAYSGLLSADRLIADLHAMEVAYLENDKNELEITRDVYLDELLMDNGINNCLTEIQRQDSIENFDIKIPEDIFNNDFKGHYFRRIRNVQIKIILKDSNSIVIDSQNIRHLSVELSLIQNTIYLNTNDTIQNRVGVQTIATSTAHLDSHQFKFKFNGEKYCPFEGAGVDSLWKLSIPGIRGAQIANIILTISYTTRKGA